MAGAVSKDEWLNRCFAAALHLQTPLKFYLEERRIGSRWKGLAVTKVPVLCKRANPARWTMRSSVNTQQKKCD
jgi:hypothetical protein